MKKIQVYCDICGREITGKEWYTALTMRKGDKGLISGSSAEVVEDICKDCVKKIEEHFYEVKYEL